MNYLRNGGETGSTGLEGDDVYRIYHEVVGASNWDLEVVA